MAFWFVKRVFLITCFAVASYAFPSTDGNGTASYFKNTGYLEESADQEILDIRDHEAVLTALQESEKFADESKMGGLNNGAMKMMNASRCDGKNKTGHCVRNKRSTPSDHPNFCDDTSLDTITRIRNGVTYLFKDNLYWKLHDHAIPEGYPRTISEDWCGLEGPLDASYTTQSGVTYFFKGSEYWRFDDKQMKQGYPKEISVGFPGIPDDVDAVLGLSNNQQIYFFKGTQYWFFDRRREPPVDADYPKSIRSKWGTLLKKGIDAAFHWQDRLIYLFKGEKYYKYNFDTFKVVEADPPYPRPTGPTWFNCR